MNNHPIPVTDTVTADPNAAPIQRNLEKAAHRAVLALIRAPAEGAPAEGTPAEGAPAEGAPAENGGGKILCIKANTPAGPRWTLPYGILQGDEPEECALARGLTETLGAHLGACAKIYEGPNSLVYATQIGVEGTRVLGKKYPDCAWLTEAQLAGSSLQGAAFYAKVLTALKARQVGQSSVISKLADGRILYAIAHEVLVPDEEGKEQWEIRTPHHVHAMDAASAREQFLQTVGPAGPPVRILGVAPAIGFFETKEGDLIG